MDEIISRFASFSSFLLAALPVQAATIIADDFTDGGRTNGADANDIQWYAGRNNVDLSVATDPGIGGGNALFVNSSTTFSRSVGLLNAGVTVGIGETLRFSFDLRYTAAPTAGGNLLRLGIFNNGGTALSGDGSGNQNDDFGYGVYTDPGSNLATGTRVATEAAGNSLLGGASPAGLTGTGDSGASVNWGTSPHSVQFSITRLGDGSLDLSSSIDGGAAATANVVPLVTGNYTFHEVAIGQGNLNRNIFVDNVQLDLIPEPSSALLLTTILLPGLAHRRRTSLRQ